MSGGQVGLGLETSSGWIDVALVRAEDGCLVAHRHSEAGQGATRRTMSEIEELLRESGRGLSDLAFLAVGLGPGSYTGVRVGIATVLGLSVARDLPTIGIPSLEAGALEAPPGARYVLATQSAGRDPAALYGQLFCRDAGAGTALASLTEPRRLVRAEVVAFLRDAGVKVTVDEESSRDRTRTENQVVRGTNGGDGERPESGIWVVGPARDRLLGPPVVMGLRTPVAAVNDRIPGELVARLGRLRWKEGLSGQALALVPLYLRPATTAAPSAG